MSTLRKSLIIGVAGLVVAATLAVMVGVIHHKNKELKRVKANYEAMAKGETDVQQVITRAELKELFSEELAKIKEYGVKPKSVQNIIDIKYVYRDSTRVRDTLIYIYDTVRNERMADFTLTGECWKLDGIITDDTIETSQFEYNDKVDVVLYKEKRKCLFKKRRVKAIAISECKGDTLAILRNLKVERR